MDDEIEDVSGSPVKPSADLKKILDMQKELVGKN
jgi:hypothetical protein